MYASLQIAIALMSWLGTTAGHLSIPVWGLPQAEFTVRGPHLAFGPRAVAPFGAIVFCHSSPIDCQPKAAHGVKVSGDRVVLTDDIFARVKAINTSVNHKMKPKIDHDWHVGGDSGDCKDYALTKRDILDEMGFPTSATLVATAVAPSGRMHAVLVLRTDRGDYVLDNLASDVRSWDSVRYLWDKVQSPDNPSIWLSVLPPATS